MKTLLALLLFAIPAQSAVFPQLALGGGYENLLLVSNTSQFTWSGTIAAFQGFRQPWAGQIKIAGRAVTSHHIDIPAFGVVNILLQGDERVRSGYLEIRATDPERDKDITAKLFCRQLTALGLHISTTEMRGTQAAMEHSIPFEITPWSLTGLAFAADTERPFPVSITVYGETGWPVDSINITYDGHRAALVTELLPSLLSQVWWRGTLRITSEKPLYVEAVRIEW